jgi:hypothetical protein
MRQRLRRISFIVGVGLTLGLLAGFGSYSEAGLLLLPGAVLAWLTFGALSVTKVA